MQKGIHSTAVVDESAKIGENTAVMAYAVIGKNVRIGAGSVVYPYVFIGDNVTIGANAAIYPGAVIMENTVMGDNAVIRAHAVIGGEGFGFATKSAMLLSVMTWKSVPARLLITVPWAARRSAEVRK